MDRILTSFKQNNCLTTFSKLWPNNSNLLPNCGNTVMKLNCRTVSSQNYCYHSPQDQPQQTSRRLHQQEKQQSSLQKMNGWLAQQEDFENNTNITFGISNNPGIWAPTCKIPPEMDVAPRYLLLIVAPLLPQLTSLSKLRSKKAIRKGLKKVFLGIIPKPITPFPQTHLRFFVILLVCRNCMKVAWKFCKVV